MRTLTVVAILGALGTVACGAGPSAPAPSPVAPTSGSTSAPISTAASLAGSWFGGTSDSSGTMMGAGMTSAMASNMTWQITQTGNAFSGVMQFPGYASGGMMTVSGTITGNTATFTMAIPGGGMMGVCSAVASGTLDLDTLIAQMHGTYAGSNTCVGAFNGGQFLLRRGTPPAASTGFTSNGQRIYMTATSASNQPIGYQGGPGMGMMRRLACVNCHRADGHGAQIGSLGQLFQAPNITWAALAAENPPYSDATVKRAITQGVDSGGGPLEWAMPRWSMSTADLDDLVSYLKTLR